MRSHMDIVRGVQFVPEIDAVASVSEDCTVKLWSFKNIENLYSEIDGNLEPYITLRGHTGPLFSVTGGHPRNKRVIFTAGSEGVIRVWNLPTLNEVNQYGDTYDGRNYCIGQWVEASGETFWDLRHHSYQQLLLTVNASQQALVWSTADLDMESQDNPGKILTRVSYAQASGVLPTSCSWVETNHNQFVVSY